MTVADQTKQRLLEAAGEEFAEKGYECARVRTICERAKVNVAAVNYHFGDKEQLYGEALLEAHRCGSVPIPEGACQGTPAEQLRAHIHHFLAHVTAISRTRSWHHTLLMREMLQPTTALDLVIREGIRPRFEHLVGILRRVCPSADDRRLHALAFSIIGQCLQYKMASAVSRRLIGEDAYEALDLEYLSDHISRFTLAALGMGPPLTCGGCEPETETEAAEPCSESASSTAG